MTQGWYPGATRLYITTEEYTVQRGMDIIGICDHITDGFDSRAHLQHADNRSSVHFLIREELGRGVVYQFMPVEWAAWGNGRYSNSNPYAPAWVRDLIARGININLATVSIEHERKWPFTTSMSGPMLDQSILLHKWLVQNYPTIVPDREHIIGHYQIDHIQRAHCPGGVGGVLFPFAHIISAINAPTPSPPPPTPEWVTFPETGHVVRRDFYEFWVQKGGLPIFGYPIKPELDNMQYFERARFERHGTTIMLGLLGSELLVCKGER